MKVTTNIWLGMLASLMLVSLASCGGEKPANTTAAQTTAPEEVINVPIELAKDSVSEYTIVYDDQDKNAASFSKTLETVFSKKGVTVPVVKASEAQADYDKEIIIGNARACVAKVTEGMKSADFAACIYGNDWVLTATDAVNYKYLGEILNKHVFKAMANGALTLDPSQNFVYSTSSYATMTYASYMDRQVRAISEDTIKEIMTKESFTASNRTKLPYRLYLPSNYDPEQSYPVLLILHGAGERGNDNTAQLVHVVRDLFDQKDSPVHNSIVIMPQCPANNQWVDTPWANGNYSLKSVPQSNESVAVEELLDKIQKTYSTDLDRYYVMGISMGGFGTWDLIMRNPDQFAAAIPICGGADVTMAETLKDHPIYTSHGSADPTVPVAGTQAMVQALKDAGSTKIIYKEVKGAGHDVWTQLSRTPAVMEWLYGHKLSDRK